MDKTPVNNLCIYLSSDHHIPLSDIYNTIPSPFFHGLIHIQNSELWMCAFGAESGMQAHQSV
jgi:hypothetical protein